MLDKKYNSIRTRALRRHNNKYKALRKKKISDNYYCYFNDNYEGYYNNLNQYNKGKIHCSCPLCRAKTNNKHRKGSLSPNYNPTVKEKRQNIKMEQELGDYFINKLNE